MAALRAHPRARQGPRAGRGPARRGAALRGRARAARARAPASRCSTRARSCCSTASSTPRSPTRAPAASSASSEVRAINRFATGGLAPDRTLLLRIAPAAGRARQAERAPSPTASSARTRPSSRRIAAAYDELARAEPQRFRAIDAAQPPSACSPTRCGDRGPTMSVVASTPTFSTPASAKFRPPPAPAHARATAIATTTTRETLSASTAVDCAASTSAHARMAPGAVATERHRAGRDPPCSLAARLRRRRAASRASRAVANSATGSLCAAPRDGRGRLAHLGRTWAGIHRLGAPGAA